MSEFTYSLTKITPKEAEFIMAAISNVPAPLNISGPIYTKIQAEIEAQNAAFLEAQNKKEGIPAAKTTKAKAKQ